MPGHNCWRQAKAERIAFLVDGEAYFSALKATMQQAHRSILIVGWEFDSRTRLERGPNATPPDTVGELLRRLVRTRPELQVHVLIWDPALLYAFDREFLPVVKHDWLSHPRLHFHLDDSHPLGASHHQKIVVIDDQVGFLGGMDISAKRWDTSGHLPGDPRRSDPGFPAYPPFHDLQVALSGPAATTLAEIARSRWRNATGRSLSPPPPATHDPWPAGLAADAENVVVAFSRTAPPWEGEGAIREVEHLFTDMVLAARRHIYIENQYFASRVVARALARRLHEDNPPEIAVVTSGYSSSFLERNTMGMSRVRLQERLQALDHGARLRLYAPQIGEGFLKIHSKVMITDGRLLRIGSANLNNRSMGLDTECDFFLEDAGRPDVAAAIAGLRDRLLGEHLGHQPTDVGEAIGRLGLHGAIIALSNGPRQLKPLPAAPLLPELLREGNLLDPDSPLETVLLAAAHPAAGAGGLRLAGRFTTGMILLALLALGAALWHSLPQSSWPYLDAFLAQLVAMRLNPLAGLLAVGSFLLLGLTGIPIFLVVVTTAAIFGLWPGGAYAFAGAMLSAALTYSIGRHLGRHTVRRLTSDRASRISRALLRHGVIAVAMLRLLPTASFTAVNLVAGATRLDTTTFLAGSTVGLLPMVLGFSLFGDRFAAVLMTPDVVNAGILAALTIGLATAGAALMSRIGRSAEANIGEAGGSQHRRGRR